MTKRDQTVTCVSTSQPVTSCIVYHQATVIQLAFRGTFAHRRLMCAGKCVLTCEYAYNRLSHALIASLILERFVCNVFKATDAIRRPENRVKEKNLFCTPELSETTSLASARITRRTRVNKGELEGKFVQTARSTAGRSQGAADPIM